MRSSFFTMIVVVLTALSPALAVADEFASAIAKAKENTRNAAGKDYDAAFGTSFGHRHVGVMARCTEKIAARDLEPFDIVARVSTSGDLEKVLVNPQTKVSVCVEKGMSRSDYPQPPTPHYWVDVHMSFRQ